jgi:hypothetical protein
MVEEAGNSVEAKKQPLALGFNEGKTLGGENERFVVGFLREPPPTGAHGSWELRWGVGRAIQDE